MLETALDYANRGIAIFPVNSKGSTIKQPLSGLMWQKSATTNTKRITAWWHKVSDAAIALPVGSIKAPEGRVTVVVDGDRPKSANVADGVEWLRALALENGYDLEQVPQVDTASGGVHWFFHVDGGQMLRNGRAQKLINGCDLRIGGKNYVLAEGSEVLSKDGEVLEYTHVDGTPSIECPVPMPEWLIAQFQPVHVEGARITPTLSALTHAPAAVNYEFFESRVIDADGDSVASIPLGAGRNEALAGWAFKAGLFIAAGVVRPSVAQSKAYAISASWGKEANPRKDMTTFDRCVRNGMQHGMTWEEAVSRFPGYRDAYYDYDRSEPVEFDAEGFDAFVEQAEADRQRNDPRIAWSGENEPEPEPAVHDDGFEGWGDDDDDSDEEEADADGSAFLPAEYMDDEFVETESEAAARELKQHEFETGYPAGLEPPEAMFEHIGTIGALARIINDQQTYDQPALALMASIATHTTLYHGLVKGVGTAHQDSQIQFHLLGIAPSTTGKTSVMRYHDKVVNKLGLHKHHAPDEWSSTRGFENYLVERGSICTTIDEFQEFIESVTAKNVAGYKQGIVKMLLKMGSVPHSYTTSHAESDKAVTVNNPYLNLYGFATPEPLAEVLTKKLMQKGMLNRFLFMMGRSVKRLKPGMSVMRKANAVDDTAFDEVVETMKVNRDAILDCFPFSATLFYENGQAYQTYDEYWDKRPGGNTAEENSGLTAPGGGFGDDDINAIADAVNDREKPKRIALSHPDPAGKLGMTEEALDDMEKLIAWSTDMFNQQNIEGLAFGRMGDMVARLALLSAVSRGLAIEGGGHEINGRVDTYDVWWASVVVDWCIRCQLHVANLSNGGSDMDKEMADLMGRIVEKLERHGASMTHHDLMRSMRPSNPDKIRSAIYALVEEKSIFRVKVQTGGRAVMMACVKRLKPAEWRIKGEALFCNENLAKPPAPQDRAPARPMRLVPPTMRV